MESCGICLNTYTKKLRQKVLCQYCPEHACKGCQQNYLLSTYDDPHCFTCKRGWSSDFMTANFPLSFRNGTIRVHRRKILFEREKAMLPAMQIYVEAKRNQRRVEVVHRDLSVEYIGKHAELSKLQSEFQKFERETYSPIMLKKAQGIIAPLSPEWTQYRAARQRWKELSLAESLYKKEHFIPMRQKMHDVNAEMAYWWSIYIHGAPGAGAEKVKREFLMRCPADECRGSLSTAYKCGTCEKHTCSECLEVLGLADETSLEALKAGHTCKPENVESAKMIKKETRPCPKCGARIFKIDGCDQMWCTVDGCSTAFSWNTGHVVTGRVHNPHYYEWLRRNGGGDAPREIGDIPCGGIPNAGIFTRHLLRSPRGAYLKTDETNKLLEIHRNVLEFEARLGAYPARPGALQNKELNVQYLMNELTEEAWKTKLEHAEAAFNRKKEIGQLLQTFVTGSADILQGIVGRMEDPSVSQTTMATFVREVAMPQLEALRAYTNETFQTMSVERHMAVPLISDKWRWEPARALYKWGPPPLENEIIDQEVVLQEHKRALDTDEETA